MKKIKSLMFAISSVALFPTLITPFIVGCSQQMNLVDDSNVSESSIVVSNKKDIETNKWKTVIDFSGFKYKGDDPFDIFAVEAKVTKFSFSPVDGSTLNVSYDFTTNVYKGTEQNEFGIKLDILDNGMLTQGIYQVDELDIEFLGKYVYKKSKNLNFRIDTYIDCSTIGHTFNFPEDDLSTRLDGFNILHYEKNWEGLDIHLFTHDGAKFVPWYKNETDIDVLTYNQPSHSIEISFKPNVAIWPVKGFYIGLAPRYFDGTIGQEIVTPNLYRKFEIVNTPKHQGPVPFVPGTNPSADLHGYYQNQATPFRYDPLTMAIFDFDLSKADNDWNYPEHNIKSLALRLGADGISFQSDFSKLKLEIYNGQMLYHHLEIVTDFVWYHDEWHDEIRFTKAGVNEILSGVNEGYTFRMSDFRVEDIDPYKPTWLIYPILQPY